MRKFIPLLFIVFTSLLNIQWTHASSDRPDKTAPAPPNASPDEHPAQASDQEPVKNKENEELFIDPETMQWVNEKQSEWSHDISSLGAYLDSFMGDTRGYQDTNKSVLKIYFDFDASEYDGFEFKPRVKLSLDLPVTKEKLRLVIENDPDEELNLKERNLSELPSTERESNDGLYGSIRYLFESEKWSRLSFDWGIKARWPPDPFARFRAVRGWDLNEYWNLTYSQEVSIFESKGFGTYSQLDFDRRLSEQYLFRATSVLDWQERIETFSFLEQFSIFHDVDDKRAIQYAIGTVAEDTDDSRFTNYYTKVTYRRRLYKDWLFYELTPGIEFQRAEDFSPNPFVSLRLEMLFAKDASRKLTTRLY